MKSLLVIELCDNDYSWNIVKALEEIKDKVRDYCPVVLKKYIIVSLIGANLKREALFGNDISIKDIQHLEKYLQKIKVTFRDKLPTYTPDGEVVDHDGGSVAMDLNTGNIWTF